MTVSPHDSREGCHDVVFLCTIPVNTPAGVAEQGGPRAKRFPTSVFVVSGALVSAIIASHWPTLCRMAERWSSNPQYSHGYVVPVFALVVLWSRREMLKRVTWKPAWVGLPLLLTGVCLRLVAIQTDVEPLDAFSLLPTVFGAVLLVGGWSILNWTWPALAFLAFMIPLPFSIDVALAMPLRRIATVISTIRSLQTFLAARPWRAKETRSSSMRLRPLFCRGSVQRPGDVDDIFRPGDGPGNDRVGAVVGPHRVACLRRPDRNSDKRAAHHGDRSALLLCGPGKRTGAAHLSRRCGHFDDANCGWECFG